MGFLFIYINLDVIKLKMFHVGEIFSGGNQFPGTTLVFRLSLRIAAIIIPTTIQMATRGTKIANTERNAAPPNSTDDTTGLASPPVVDVEARRVIPVID
jgi:hypothetical protein